jgi:hypothetical protein
LLARLAGCCSKAGEATGAVDPDKLTDITKAVYLSIKLLANEE